tara:strand:- start:617 stop:1270 length:654 start_codon:yes stop_codon:yes gene_type:complete
MNWSLFADNIEPESQYQIQLLQQEVMKLRGLIESLEYEIKRQKSVSDDRYLELDARLQNLLNEDILDKEGLDPDDQSIEVLPDFELSGEKELYDTARQLIRNRQYEKAVDQLSNFIQSFPESQLIANAYYWLGQVYAAKIDPDLVQAKQALAQVISYFPDHSKVPDAAFALGKVHYALGDCERAKTLLSQVVDQYPGKSAAKLSENYLRDIGDCAVQ